MKQVGATGQYMIHTATLWVSFQSADSSFKVIGIIFPSPQTLSFSITPFLKFKTIQALELQGWQLLISLLRLEKTNKLLQSEEGLYASIVCSPSQLP